VYHFGRTATVAKTHHVTGHAFSFLGLADAEIGDSPKSATIVYFTLYSRRFRRLYNVKYTIVADFATIVA